MAKTPKTPDPLLKKHEEYVKLSSEQEKNREQPSQQMPGGRGYDLPEYERWTEEELHALAQSLSIPNHEEMNRAYLIDALMELRSRRKQE